MNRLTMVKDKPTRLVSDYEEGDFYLASPEGTILGKGCVEKVAVALNKGENESLSKEVRKALDRAQKNGFHNPIVVGAVPFESGIDPELSIPEKVAYAKPYRGDRTSFKTEMKFDHNELKSVPSSEVYIDGVKRALEQIKNQDYQKVVLSRSLQVQTKGRIEVKEILKRLSDRNADGYTFGVHLSNKQNSTTFIGASPELLVSRRKNRVIANPLAGSRARSLDPEEDERRAAELMISEKDLHEHALVVNEVCKGLEGLCPELDVPENPSLIKTETMWHLSTVITGKLSNPEMSSLDLAMALHPTPAVCGYPAEAAYQAIREIEPFDRNYFTGMVGWCDAQGDGEWVVAIRCAEINENSMTLYAGAGVVAASKPEEELAETGAKFQTMLDAMGLQK
ncbi:isochorismate synthase DhbC [Hazenella sp. IB182357]|uniref:isochorismate synthase n=1 Tax=Polycladospora coralii TaxID=2771432 RepID=A0A926NCD8_9BACL|nr:isochorismate synthase DhbC [Polycladospora coralii]MBD1371004.1 isochorismate synthase DhbC [Polycladospora coralii]MBS7529943.1 isochorismate synthase DhbC [Polycladospora coralii]